MHLHVELIEKFYAAFARLDAEAMVSCYHDEVRFTDPVFPMLRGEHAGNMWRMLCSNAIDLKVRASAISADDNQGSAHWDATYTFSKTKRFVENKIDAVFDFKDGKIVRHVDSFGLWKWTRMALGPVGILLGWSPLVQNKLRREAAKQLIHFEEARQK